jgi:hypothetical protein
MRPFEAGRELAAGIPGAKFALLEGDAHVLLRASRIHLKHLGVD